MGLDTTHDCWHGPYSTFNDWRVAVARAAGIELLAMEGFTRLPHLRGGPTVGDTDLGMSWSKYAHDPICILLNHSDCDGTIVADDCVRLADRLEELLPALEAMDAQAPLSWLANKACDFVAGLRAAAAACEDVEFH
jgi:hypothetical protein